MTVGCIRPFVFLILGILGLLMNFSPPDSLPPVPSATSGPAQVEARYQLFEHGFMLQILNSEYQPTDCVYAFSTLTGNIIIPAAMTSSYQYCIPIEGLPPVDPADPFGQVWSYYTEVRDGLGAATLPETIYTGFIPPADPVIMGGIFYKGIMTLPDGRQLYCGQRAATAGTCKLRNKTNV
jgi:hypothetical protein